MDFITPIINDMAGETGKLVIGNTCTLTSNGTVLYFNSIYEINNLNTFKTLDIEIDKLIVLNKDFALSHIIRVLLVYKNIVWIKFRLSCVLSHLFCVRYLRKQRHLLRADILVQTTSFYLCELRNADQIYCKHFYVPALRVVFMTSVGDYSMINRIISSADCHIYETNGTEHVFDHMKHCILISRINRNNQSDIHVPRSIVSIISNSNVVNKTYGLHTITTCSGNGVILNSIHKLMSSIGIAKIWCLNDKISYKSGKILENMHHDITITDSEGTYHFPTAIVKSVEIVSVNNDICKYAINKFL
jgi:hypothetical protein